LLHAGEVVPIARLVDDLWGATPPATAEKTVRVYASRLRKLLAGRIESVASGLRIRIEASELDLAQLEELRAQAREQPDAGAAATLRAALDLFRGPPLADFRYEAWAQTEIGRLEELLTATLEERIDADLELGRHAELVAELEALTREHPLRERLAFPSGDHRAQHRSQRAIADRKERP
jgi:DNA-binding SARP family transcriptional activator